MECISIFASLADGIPKVSSVVELHDVSSSIWGSQANVESSIACIVGEASKIYFSQPLLAWSMDENKIGVIKYNTLTAVGRWSLEEVDIEELL